MACALTTVPVSKTLACRVQRNQPKRAQVVRVGCSGSSNSEQSASLGRRTAVTGAGAVLLAGLTAAPPQALARDKPGVYWLAPKDGAVIEGPVKVKMGVTGGLEVKPAADGPQEGTGHHHILIDYPDSFYPNKEAIPFEDGKFVHYGKAQTEGELNLPPGKHKLTLQFANYKHQSYGKNLAKTIYVTVK